MEIAFLHSKPDVISKIKKLFGEIHDENTLFEKDERDIERQTQRSYKGQKISL